MIEYDITEIDSGCMQYRNLWIRDIVDQTPRHRLRSCFRSNTKTPAQIMLPCAVWHTVAARNRTKTIKPSLERSPRPPADVPVPRRLQHRRGWRRLKGIGRRWGGGVIAGATWMCVPLLYLDGISMFFNLELQFEFYFLCARSPYRVEAPGKVSLKRSSFNISCILNLSQWYKSCKNINIKRTFSSRSISYTHWLGSATVCNTYILFSTSFATVSRQRIFFSWTLCVWCSTRAFNSSRLFLYLTLSSSKFFSIDETLVLQLWYPFSCFSLIS